MLEKTGGVLWKAIKYTAAFAAIGALVATGVGAVAVGLSLMGISWGWGVGATILGSAAASASSVATAGGIFSGAFWTGLGTMITTSNILPLVAGSAAVAGAAGAVGGTVAGIASIPKSAPSAADMDPPSPFTVSPELAREHEMVMQRTHEAGYRAAIERERAAAAMNPQTMTP